MSEQFLMRKRFSKNMRMLRRV